MISLVKRLVLIAIALFVAHFFLETPMRNRFADHWNGCNEQLGLSEHLATQRGEELNQTLEEFRGCVVRKTTFIDGLFFSKTDIDTAIAGLKMMHADR